jgi:hypothetical protein
MLLLFGLVLAALVIGAVVQPLVTGREAPLTDGPDRATEIREVEALRDIALETLRDLEFDRHAGKIADADYRELSERTRDEAARLMERLDRLRSGGAPAATPPG